MLLGQTSLGTLNPYFLMLPLIIGDNLLSWAYEAKGHFLPFLVTVENFLLVEDMQRELVEISFETSFALHP